MPVTALNHYLIVSKNLERSKKFYQEVLGLDVAERPDFGFPGYWLKTGDNICVHLASQAPNRIRDRFLLKKHPKGTNGSGSVDHIAFLAEDPNEVRSRIQKNKVELRKFPDPAPGPGEVVIQMKASGMCGSDLKFYRPPPGAAQAALGLGSV